MITLKIKVTPKANEDKVVGFEEGVLKVKVRAPPEDGKANDAVISLLAKHFKIPKREIILKSGATSRIKIILIDHKGELALFPEPEKKGEQLDLF